MVISIVVSCFCQYIYIPVWIQVYVNRIGPHGNEDKFKARILLLFIREVPNSDEIKPPWTRSKLIRKFEETENTKSVDKSIDYHLYDRRNGLVTTGILTSKDGYISFNWKSKTLPKVIEILGASEEVGPRVRYLFRKAFLESFFSEYGDVLLNEWKLSTFLYERNEATAKLLKDEDPDIADIYNLELRKRIGKNLKGITWWNYSWDDTYRGKIYSENKEIRDERERMDRMVDQMVSISPESLPSMDQDQLNKFFIERWTEIGKVEDNLNLLESQVEGVVKEGIEEIKKEVDKLDLVSVLIDFAKEVRVNVDTAFMLSYILNVMKIEKSAKEIERDILVTEWDTNPIRLKRIPDFIMAYRTNSEILSSLGNSDPGIIRSFVEKVLLKAMSDSVVIDNSISKEISKESPVLKLYEAYVSNFITARRQEVSQLLSDFITLGSKHLTSSERDVLEFERMKEGLTTRPIIL